MASFILVLRNIDQQEGQTALSSVCLFKKKTKQKPKVQVLLAGWQLSITWMLLNRIASLADKRHLFIFINKTKFQILDI